MNSETDLRFKRFFEQSYSVILIIDPEGGRIIDGNKAAIDFYGYSHQELTSMKISDINMLGSNGVQQKMYLTVEKNGQQFIFDHKLANGQIRNVEVHTGPVDIGNSQLIYSIIHDITPRIKAERELVVAKEKAEEADRLKSEFLAIMSHELKTPLNAIVGFSDLIKNNPDLSQEEVVNFASIINKSGMHLNFVISDIFNLALLHTNQLTVVRSKSKVVDLVNELSETVSVVYKTSQVGFEYHIGNGLDNVEIDSDVEKIRQVLLNLLDNAFKYSTSGVVKLLVLQNQEKIMFSVEDQGKGIDPKVGDKIFEYFVQEDNSSSRRVGGTGVGLAISRGIAELLKGSIYYESAPGVGSKFFFSVPIVFKVDEK
ncbi:PAS domain-containing sensor histidine kinase [Puteibacter caeruleilacunae]|nr:PAS domain-containing sensor histidine kinase [Puteibacter caeruleilacunae]